MIEDKLLKYLIIMLAVVGTIWGITAIALLIIMIMGS